jgi:hypothetical protein
LSETACRRARSGFERRSDRFRTSPRRRSRHGRRSSAASDGSQARWSLPILAVFAAFAGSAVQERFAGRALVVVTALFASLTMTAAYHLGYDDFRSGKVRSPVAGDVAWSVPTPVTLNSIGAPIAHVGVHVAAVLRLCRSRGRRSPRWRIDSLARRLRPATSRRFRR